MGLYDDCMGVFLLHLLVSVIGFNGQKESFKQHLQERGEKVNNDFRPNTHHIILTSETM